MREMLGDVVGLVLLFVILIAVLSIPDAAGGVR